MRIIYPITTLILIFQLISCRNDNYITRLYNANYVKTENNIPYFKCDSLMMNPLGIELEPKILENNYPGFFDKSVEIVKDIHNPDIMDTIVNFSRNNNLVQFRVEIVETVLSAFESDDPAILMAGNIHVGLTKKDFATIFGINSFINDKCDIGNSRDSNKFRFVFDNNKLTHISYLSYINN